MTDSTTALGNALRAAADAGHADAAEFRETADHYDRVVQEYTGRGDLGELLGAYAAARICDWRIVNAARITA